MIHQLHLLTLSAHSSKLRYCFDDGDGDNDSMTIANSELALKANTELYSWYY